MLEWIKQGNIYSYNNDDVPDHPQLTSEDGGEYCLTSFPVGVLTFSYPGNTRIVGEKGGQLVPGLYEYRREGDNRVEGRRCTIILNSDSDNASSVEMVYGETFTLQVLRVSRNGWLKMV